MSQELFDPTTQMESEDIDYAPRPEKLEGLRVGLVENTKFNSKEILLLIAKRLETKYGITVTHMDTKQSASHGVAEAALAEFKAKADFVIAGIGD